MRKPYSSLGIFLLGLMIVPFTSFAAAPITPLQSGDVIYIFPLHDNNVILPSSSTPTTLPDQKTAITLAPPITISWHTDVPATSEILFSTSTLLIDISSPYTPQVIDNKLTTNHSVKLQNLYPDTTYNIVYQSRNSDGVLIVSNFMNLSVPAASDIGSSSLISNVRPFSYLPAPSSSGNTPATP